MKQQKNKPIIKITRTTTDWVIEFATLIFLILLMAIPLIYYNKLPETIAVHFNAAGQPDGYGSRSTLWILPVTSLFLYLLFTILEAYPHVYNYPVEITPDNAYKQYRLATRLMRILKTVILMIFSFLSYKTIRTATGEAAGLGKTFLPIFLILTFGVIIIYIVRSLNNRYNN